MEQRKKIFCTSPFCANLSLLAPVTTGAAFASSQRDHMARLPSPFTKADKLYGQTWIMADSLNVETHHVSTTKAEGGRIMATVIGVPTGRHFFEAIKVTILKAKDHPNYWGPGP